jgi:indole-3-glycerol phosphate synthase
MSVTNKSKRRGTILDEIMRYKREQLPNVMRAVPLADLRAFASVAPPPSDFESALKTPGVSLIAECKKASPSRGLISPDYDPVQLARTYVEGGASAISVLTDARYFQGSLGDLRDVKEMIGSAISPKYSSRPFDSKLPVLRKDFTFHAYHVYEARAAGADAILLIAAVLEGGELESLQDLAHELGMGALVEVHTEEELDRVLAINPRIVGINNRDLQTFEVDFDNSARLRAKIPEGVVTIAESGIKSIDDVKRMVELNVDAILVGETLVRSKNILAQTRAFVVAGKVA